jgi:polyisoprenoid-binding protein YceI
MTKTKILALCLLATACNDPAAGKPKAGAAPAKPEAPKTNDVRERLAILPDSSTIEFTASKVSRSHPGGFTGFTGTIELAPAQPEASLITVTIDMATIFVDDADLTMLEGIGIRKGKIDLPFLQRNGIAFVVHADQESCWSACEFVHRRVLTRTV